jgi:hypothetical protein
LREIIIVFSFCEYFLEEDVCLILCQPLLGEVVGLLASLSAICRDAPDDLADLAFGSLQSESKPPPAISPPLPPPIPMEVRDVYIYGN